MRFLVMSVCVVLLLVSPLGKATVAQGSAGAPRGLDDRPVSLDLREMDLRTALNLIAEQNGLNIVSGDEVVGEVTGHFDRVPITEVLEALLYAGGYRYEVVGDVIVVTAAEETATRFGETRVIPIRHVDGALVSVAIGKLLSPLGSVQLYPHHEEATSKALETSGGPEACMLIVHDERHRVEQIASVVASLDKAPKQLMIEVRLVETTLGNEHDLGFNWNPEAGIMGNIEPQSLPLDSDRFTFGTLSLEQFSVVLKALVEDRNSKLISNPRITTQDNQEARISVGTIFPVRTVSRFSETGVTQDLLTYEDKEINIELSVTPHISSDDGMITLVVAPSVQDIVGWTGEYNDQPITSKRELTTRVTVKDGETIAMGGLIKETEIDTKKRIWFLGRIPILGRLLFTNSVRSKETTDMLIFITPHILTP